MSESYEASWWIWPCKIQETQEHEWFQNKGHDVSDILHCIGGSCSVDDNAKIGSKATKVQRGKQLW